MKLLGGILLLFLGILLIPVRLHFSFRPDPVIALQILWWKQKLVPTPPAKKSTGIAHPRKKSSEKAPPSIEWRGILSQLEQWLSAVTPSVLWLLRHTTIGKFRLLITVAKADAAETAIAYGQMQAWVMQVYGWLDCFFRLRPERMELRPDFIGGESTFSLTGTLKILPITAVIAALQIIWRMGISRRPTIERKHNDGKQASDQ